MDSATVSRVAAAFLSPFFATGMASSQEAEKDEEKRLTAEEQVVVTGSRIRRKDLLTAAPVSIFTRQEIDESGHTSIGEFLQLMPAQGNAVNTQVNNAPVNAGDGSTRISLRSLGEKRTLVLVNGRRFVNVNGAADSSVDLNAIPAAAVERIEVLQDGASAVYGSDSIGGVVNIITRRRFNTRPPTIYNSFWPTSDATTYDFVGRFVYAQLKHRM